MIKEIGFVTPVFLSGLVGRPITTWGGVATSSDRGMRLIVPLSPVVTLVPWHNVAWWTEDVARIDVTEQAAPWPGTDQTHTAPVPAEFLNRTAVSPAPGKGKKR